MSLVQTIDRLEYPESDGKPMGETDLHRDWMVRILEVLRFRYRGQRVYVASNLLVYYEEGEPSQFIVPDDFVVTDCSPRRRRTYKTWEEGKVPEVVFEVTSRSSRRQDQVFKPQVYVCLGVPEYFLYDPTAEYLKPALQGYRLVRRRYTRIKADAKGAVACRQLDLTLRLEQGDLVMYDGSSGERLLSPLEAAEAAHEAEKAARKAEKTAREAAEARAAELETEVRRLRAELSRRRKA